MFGIDTAGTSADAVAAVTHSTSAMSRESRRMSHQFAEKPATTSPLLQPTDLTSLAGVF
jgi:hypothetical protein